MNNESRFSLIADLNEESGDGVARNMDGKSSGTINAIVPLLGFSLGETSGPSLSGSKNKGKALQGSRLRKKGENRKIIEEQGDHKVVMVEENWDPNIMVVEGESMSNKLGLKFLEGGPSFFVPPEPSTVKWGKFRDQNHHGL
ncbi:hypothetical protein PVK06_035298 [Gossypium arboreum]|uniref:Uncharacterized protein n=1 Tax=Gossypium arboreum TaxID=29729 RepID=A0ABR0NGF4_GOSAR|nr:hypothetical protein PVK06_035298 [Gossypium arboreum]